MNTTLKTILIALLVLVVGGGLFFAGQAYSRWNSASFYGDGWMPMMGGRGAGNDPSMTLAPGASAGVGNGQSPMMGNGQSPMMGNGFNTTNAQPLTIDEAKAAAQNYIDSLDVSGLELDEVMVFDNNTYVIVKETGTGIGAFELLVDSGSNVAYPEHGANMMWNLKYSGLNHQNMTLAPGASAGVAGGNGFMMGGGMMDGGMMDGGMMGGGMMGGGMMTGQNFTSGDVLNVSSEMTVTEEQAIQAAQAYLDENFPEATVADHGTAFYGYYTFDFTKDGKIAGMLSVNGYSSQVFYHTWHGTFIEEAEME